MSKTVIKSCGCSNAYQDKTYGPGLRVFNTSMDGAKSTCTVCGKSPNSGGKK